MNFLNRNLPVFVTAGFIYLTGFFVSNPGRFGYCAGSADASRLCSIAWGFNFGLPLLAAGEALAIVAVILLFSNDEGWRRWLHFSKWYVPIAVLVVALLFPIALPLDAELSRQGAAIRFGQLYEVITLCVVLMTRFRARRAISK